MTKGQNIDQSYQSVAGIARSLYGRVFSFIVEKCNTTLVDDTMKKAVFIGVLDIAGFEIFEFNGFEQLCINFCNEVSKQQSSTINNKQLKKIFLDFPKYFYLSNISNTKYL